MSSTAPVAFVTGGASGIGLAVVNRWIAEGGHAVIADVRVESLDEAVGALPVGTARGVVCDVTDRASVDAARASVAGTEARLDAVVNSAGIARPEPSSAITDAAFQLMLEIHVTGSMRVCRAAYPLLRASGGAIVNVASVAAIAGLPERASYTSAKSAIGGLTRTLAVEWGRTGVRVNAVAPGYVRTALTDKLIRDGDLNDEPVRSRTPLGRFAEPDEIAGAVQFLAGLASSFVNGHVLVVDGGLTIDGDWY
ncbi:SDR family NAD(P)-dependent oxidoreductase [Microbacterium gorillae]|uniref:SDR family NAD(P)-dependent oxidoreductase n=1 Tax=Microbacterium gorillae TaxID=1231063 RepID=UPI00058ED97C|nr:SDR family oxidoreductase [Microbacterium gorillae]